MPSRADYRCRECGKIVEHVFDFTPPPVVDKACCVGDMLMLHERVYTPFHTGTGSNGEKPK